MKNYSSHRNLESLSSIDLTKAVKRACIVVENRAKELAPVDTGELRASITHEVESGGLKVTGAVGTNLTYAPYVECGTGLFAADGNGRQTPWSYKGSDGEWHTTICQKPQPFIKPALDQMAQDAVNEIKQEILKEIHGRAGL